MSISCLRLDNEKLFLIDQRKLPKKYTEFECENYRDVIFAIAQMVVRGAPAIGATAAYGMWLAGKEFSAEQDFLGKMKYVKKEIDAARPTAVNLVWATSRMLKVLEANKTNQENCQILKSEADQIAKEDIEINKKMGEIGAKIVPQKATILTHCNTGALATVGHGTALGVIRSAIAAGKDIFVYADETRPRLQGARLTAWELSQEKIPSCLIADSVAATLIWDGKIDLILVGADRIAANGDTANKIGTFMLSVLAQRYGVPFYVVAPTSTIDLHTPSGKQIIIEERDDTEVSFIFGKQVAPLDMSIYNPAFDVTPAENITGIITEKGIVQSPFSNKLTEFCEV